ncbi:MAG TPA: hypothetical protein VF141_22500 [Chryseolinea sp.]
MKHLLTVILSLALLACSSDDPQILTDDDPLKGLPDKGPIRFDNPEVGQRSFYVFFKATKNNTQEVTFEYMPDTLVLAITGKEGDKWILNEFLANGSESKTSANGNWSSLADVVITRHLEVEADSAFFSRPAGADPFSFVFVGESRTVPLLPVEDPAPINVNCMPKLAYASTLWMQYTVNYSQFGQTFQHLNNYFDYRPMATDGSGFMYAYGSQHGLVRWTWVSYWSLDYANGWDLIPN